MTTIEATNKIEMWGKRFSLIIAHRLSSEQNVRRIQSVIESILSDSYLDENQAVKKLIVEIVEDEESISSENDVQRTASASANVEVNTGLSEVERLCNQLRMNDDESDKEIVIREMQDQIRTIILRVARAIKDEFDTKIVRLENQLAESKIDVANLKHCRSTPDAIHVLLNFVRLARHNIKVELVKRGHLASTDVKWELVKRQIRNSALLIEIVEGFGIEPDDWFLLQATCAQLNAMKHGLESVAEAEARIAELKDSAFANMIPVFRRFLAVIKTQNWQFPTERI